ncbi:hypothetical protein [Aquisediminimonas sediminicola]|uniref:hypothetical protein n=1 Tax=Alteraquisediminimonas sediminicola TaxID=2676787 RepID=UPI001C8DFC72|nr:hypothetical protein [Aquisediminimonas sediminicola]
MAVTKPIASLSSSLLARKGQAKPAMRPQGYASLAMTNMQPDQPHMATEDLGWNDMGHETHDPHKTLKVSPLVSVQRPLAVVAPVVAVETLAEPELPEAVQPVAVQIEVVQEAPVFADIVQADIVQAANDEATPFIPAVLEQQRKLAELLGATVEEPAARNKEPAVNKAAFTLRLDEDRHLRLRLASAVSRRSAQRLVTEALDRFLEGLEDIDQLTSHLNAKSTARRH